MNHTDALRYAAQAWCTPTTEKKIMDPELAEAFAILLRVHVGQAEQTRRIADARRTIADAFTADPDFRRTYVDNIAMRLYDTAENHQEVFGEENPFSVADVRNDLASSIVDLVFKG